MIEIELLSNRSSNREILKIGYMLLNIDIGDNIVSSKIYIYKKKKYSLNFITSISNDLVRNITCRDEKLKVCEGE